MIIKNRRIFAVSNKIVLLCACIFAALSCGDSQAVKRVERADSKKVGEVDMLNTADEKELPSKYVVTNRVEIKTSHGSFVVGIYGEDAPNTIANFLSYVDNGFYSGKIFHRVIPGFMIQGGGFDAELTRAPTEANIKLEIIPGLKHEPGIVSMARTSDPNSATSQFFVCVGTPTQLNGGYAAFGKVEKGNGVVEKIAAVQTDTAESPNGPMANVPVDDVVIESITRL